ncbi:hypothetical protein [Sporosarcina sp. ITBMC105]
MTNQHVIFYSGGLGSWMTAVRVIAKYGADNVICLFTDTLIEDEDLYRFLIESTSKMYGISAVDLIAKANAIPATSYETMDERKRYLSDLAVEVSARIPRFIWLNDGIDPWDVFKSTRFLGNSRLAKCSHILKQDMARKYIEANFAPGEVTLYLGIDWTEEHRTKAPVENWAPYSVKFPMCEEPLLTKIDAVKALESADIEVPRLYGMGFSHNNCGGFCVRAGQGHFVNLLEQKPELYAYHEAREQEMRDFLDKDVAILRRQRNGVKSPLTLRELREEHAQGSDQIDMFDVGGCGCFVDDGEAVIT